MCISVDSQVLRDQQLEKYPRTPVDQMRMTPIDSEVTRSTVKFLWTSTGRLFIQYYSVYECLQYRENQQFDKCKPWSKLLLII